MERRGLRDGAWRWEEIERRSRWRRGAWGSRSSWARRSRWRRDRRRFWRRHERHTSLCSGVSGAAVARWFAARCGGGRRAVGARAGRGLRASLRGALAGVTLRLGRRWCCRFGRRCRRCGCSRLGLNALRRFVLAMRQGERSGRLACGRLVAAIRHRWPSSLKLFSSSQGAAALAGARQPVSLDIRALTWQTASEWVASPLRTRRALVCATHRRVAVARLTHVPDP
jgi:hypothetical protein